MKKKLLPTLLPPVVDRLAFTVQVPSAAQKAVENRLTALITELQGATACNLRLSSARYQRAYRLPLTVQESCRIDIRHRASAQSQRMGFLRLEYNPAKVGELGDQHVKRYLKELLGPKHFTQLGDLAFITRLDVAQDVAHAHLSDLFAHSSQLKSGVWYDQHGQPQTLYLGSAKQGPIFFRLYDKRAEQAAKGQSVPDHPLLRIEVQFRPRRLLNQRDGGDIDALITRAFSSVHLLAVNRCEEPSTDLTWTLFLDSARLRGLQAALRLLPADLRHTYSAHLKNLAAVDWWSADKLRRHCAQAIRHLGIFPASFLADQVRQRPVSSRPRRPRSTATATQGAL
jgi:hypothetical protein